MSWVKDRLREYSKGKRMLEQYRDQIAQTYWEEPHPDTKPVKEMIADMNSAMEWMRTGRRPHTRRGIDIKDAYSRAILMDMDLLPTTPPEQELVVTEKQKQELAKILLRLSSRELQCFLMHAVQGMSFAEIGKEMKISKASVQRFVTRAKSKAGQAI